jgi:hypothetical protein
MKIIITDCLVATPIRNLNVLLAFKSHLGLLYVINCRRRDIIFGPATCYGLDGQAVRFRVPVGAKFSLLHVAQTDSEVHSDSYPVGTERDFPEVKAAGA